MHLVRAIELEHEPGMLDRVLSLRLARREKCTDRHAEMEARSGSYVDGTCPTVETQLSKESLYLTNGQEIILQVSE